MHLQNVSHRGLDLNSQTTGFFVRNLVEAAQFREYEFWAFENEFWAFENEFLAFSK